MIPGEENFVRRCRWCEQRTGAARYFDGVDWIHQPNPVHYFGSAQFSDSICPECAEVMAGELRRLNLSGVGTR